ncbi:hypothetical protein K1T71_007544 [Dendrolimus kikuchii]|uniref:Uncharacterized protein n=1 Tax=Dendrolimus kikuchii TaxID=765133 RepID=A0ACC1CXS4_9NEOP|nr:hypothetical protein K1T71_007544 [Dendrolimus kikuchii]
MVGRNCTLDDILNEKQLDHVIRESIAGNVAYKLLDYEINPAVDGLSGFLGDHMRVRLKLKVEERVEDIRLFIKRMPMGNAVKKDFIVENKFFWREMTVFKLLEDFKGAYGPNPWVTKAYIYTDTLLVMPDLSFEGYISLPLHGTFDLPHVLLTTASIARFHASCANYETNKTLNGNHPYRILDDYGHVFFETTFQDTLWMRAAAKLTANLLKEFSTKYHVKNLEENLAKSYVAACDTLKEYEGDLNVLVHKDLWNNNILFKYENGAPVNSVIIDFQCTRYGPPTFDLLSFFYLTTSRSFRERNEHMVFEHYFKTFMENVDEVTKLRMKEINYDKVSFMGWCERSRMFGMMEAICIFPYVLMDPKNAQRVFDDPDTYIKYLNEDRSEPVIAYAKICKPYRERQVELSEEYVQKYIINHL